MTNATHETTIDAAAQPPEPSIALLDLLDKVEGFIIAIDEVAGDQMEHGPAGYYWPLGIQLTCSPRVDSRTAGCIFALRAISESSTIVDKVPSLLAKALRAEHGTFPENKLTDEVMVDLIPIVAAFLSTPEGKERYGQIQQEKDAG